MNTYGVSLDGYRPTPECEAIINEAIPAYEKMIHDDECAIAVLEKTLALYKDAHDGFEMLWEACGKLNFCLNAEVPSSGEVLKRQLGIAERDLAHEMIADRRRLTESLDKAIADATTEVEDIKFHKNSCQAYVEFYRAFLERQQFVYVFWNVELKYKVKVCRDAIKAFSELKSMCDRCRALFKSLPPKDLERIARDPGVRNCLADMDACAENAEAYMFFCANSKRGRRRTVSKWRCGPWSRRSGAEAVNTQSVCPHWWIREGWSSPLLRRGA